MLNCVRFQKDFGGGETILADTLGFDSSFSLEFYEQEENVSLGRSWSGC